jgi:transcriptional regulator with XRE-family HTH domain
MKSSLRGDDLTILSRMEYNIAMTTQATISGLDLICEALGVSLEKLAKRAKLTNEELYEAHNGHWRPATISRLSDYLGVSSDFFEIPTEYLAALLKAFSVVEPWSRFKLIDKIWTIEIVWRAMEEHCAFPCSGSPRLSDLLEAYSDHSVRGPGSFVAFVRRELERSRVLVFSHPFWNSDYTAILFVPGERCSPFKYLVVNEIEWLSPLTNALFQWYEVLRLLSRWDNTDDEDGFSINPEASWTAVYLEPTVDGYCPGLNEQLRKRFALQDFSVIFFGGDDSDALTLRQCWWYSIFHALMEGLPPAAVAEYCFRSIRFDGEERDAEFVHLLNQPSVIDEVVKQMLRPLSQPSMVDEIVKQIVRGRIVPIDYDWVIPGYPSFVQRLVMTEVAQRHIPRHIMLRVLSISEDDYNAVLEKLWQSYMQDLPKKQ